MSAVTGTPQTAIPALTVVKAAFLVATLDILSAFADVWLTAGKGPAVVLRYVASGVFGSAAFSGGGGMLLYGLLFHYVIAFCWTFLFFRLYTKMPSMRRNWLITGVVFTVLLWAVMNMVVVPLSRVNHTALSAVKPLKFIKSFLILLFMIGLPLSLIACRAERPAAAIK